MIRKLMTACAGLAMMSGSALALDVTGTYAGQSNGQNLSIQLQERNGTVRGSVRIAGGEFPIAGQEQDGQLRGIWQTPDGQQIPFAGQVSDGHLQLSTNGAVYSLQNSTPSNNANNRPAAPVQQQPRVEPQVQSAPTPSTGQMTVRMEQGQIFARPVPNGWKATESCNEVFIVSPDSSMSFGFTGFEGLTPMTPNQFVQWMLVNVYKHQNLQFVQQRDVPGAEGTQTIEGIITFNDNGVQWKSWIRCTVLTAYNSSNGYILFATAHPENFENAVPQLTAMADKIQITDQNAVFDRARRLGVIRSIQNNPIPDTIIMGYNERNHIMEASEQRRSDVATDTYKLTSDSGQVYYMGQGAYDATIGGFRDPEHPERILHMEPHWNGH